MLFVCIGLAYASDSYSQSATLTLNVNNKTVQEVLDEIEKQSEFRFFRGAEVFLPGISRYGACYLFLQGMCR